MKLDEASMLAFLFVFIRSSAMFLTAPVFGSSTTPPKIRIFIALALAGALAFIVKPVFALSHLSLFQLVAIASGEVVMGVLIGGLMNIVMEAAAMAGSILDLQIGLSASQVLNPYDGISVTILAQFKSLLAMVIFLSINGHYYLINGLVESYQLHGVGLTLSPVLMEQGVVKILEVACVLAVQISAPTLAVSVIIDAALGLVTKAVPQMQALNVGIPIKLGVGILAVSFSLPPLVAAVSNGTADVFGLLGSLMRTR